MAVDMKVVGILAVVGVAAVVVTGRRAKADTGVQPQVPVAPGEEPPPLEPVESDVAPGGMADFSLSIS